MKQRKHLNSTALFSFFCVLSFVLVHNAAAQTTWTAAGVFSGKHSISGSFGITRSGGIERGHYPLSLRYLFELPRVSASGGIQYNKDTFDITVNGVYFPLNQKHFRAGAGASYHAGWLSNTEENYLIAFQNDFTLGFYSSVSFWLMFFNLDAGFLGQLLAVPALPKEKMLLFQPDMFVSLYLGAKILPNFSVEIGVSSYDFFRYNLFLNPMLSFALRYEFLRRYFKEKPFEGGIFAGFKLQAQYSDMFTLSGYVKYMRQTFTVGYTF